MSKTNIKKQQLIVSIIHPTIFLKAKEIINKRLFMGNQKKKINKKV